jgi:hypothetical protein
MSDPDQTREPSTEGTAETQPAPSKSEKPTRSAGRKTTGSSQSPKPVSRARTSTSPSRRTRGSSPPGQPGATPGEEREGLTGVAGVDRSDPFQHGRRVWPD